MSKKKTAEDHLVDSYTDRAIALYDADDNIDFDDELEIEFDDKRGGAWVQAWLYVPPPSGALLN